MYNLREIVTQSANVKEVKMIMFKIKHNMKFNLELMTDIDHQVIQKLLDHLALQSQLLDKILLLFPILLKIKNQKIDTCK